MKPTSIEESIEFLTKFKTEVNMLLPDVDEVIQVANPDHGKIIDDSLFESLILSLINLASNSPVASVRAIRNLNFNKLAQKKKLEKLTNLTSQTSSLI